MRQLDTGERIISRADLRTRLLPVVPERHRAVTAVGAGAGVRWGEAVGLRDDALDLTSARLSVIRTVIEVSGHTAFKPYPESRAGRRSVPLPGWLVDMIREHLRRRPALDGEPLFANEVGTPVRRTSFRSRIWRPSLVRAGLLGAVVALDGGFEAQWTDDQGAKHTERLRTKTQAVHHVARHQADGLRFHDLRHMARRRRGAAQHGPARHGKERPTTTLDPYTRRTDNGNHILQALDDADEGDAASPVPAPVRG